jgi:hypothetical protein
MLREEVPQWWVEKLLLGELSPARQRALEARLTTDPALAARLEALRRSNADLAATHPVAVVVAQIREKARREAAPRHAAPNPWRRLLTPVLLAPALVALVAGVLLLPPGVLQDDIRDKGAPAALIIYRQVPGGAEPLRDGAAVHPGDLLQLAYGLDRQAYGVIFSIDGRGQITLHEPTAGAQAVPLKRGAAVLLGHAYQEDDAPGAERFYLVTAATPFALGSVMDIVKKHPTGSLPLPEYFQQSSITLQKVFP